jgi:lipopolysaccharide transport system permease protein
VHPQHHIVIRKRTGIAHLQLGELWEYRELIGFLAWRDILIRYKQTVIGVAWALVRPLATMFVFVLVFGRIGKLPSDGVPYALLTFSGLLPWQLFSNAFGESSASIVGNSTMISKVYFPRLIAPVSSVIGSLIDFAIMCVVLAGLLLWYRIPVGPTIVWLPAFTLLVMIVSLGFGIWFSALYVKYRDVRHLIPFIIQLGTYISPVGFSSSVVPAKWRLLYALNPLVAVIDGFRWSIFGRQPPHASELIASSSVAVIVLVGGMYYFRQTERTFADII